MTVSRSQSPTRRTEPDYQGVRQATLPTSGLEPESCDAPYGNAAAQDQAGFDQAGGTPVLDALGFQTLDDGGTSDCEGGAYIDPFSNTSGARPLLDRSPAVGSARPSVARASLDASRGMAEGATSERQETSGVVSMTGNQVDAGVRWDDLRREGEHTRGTSQAITGRAGRSGYGVAASRAETSATADGGSRAVGQSLGFTTDGTLSGAVSTTRYDASGKAGNTTSAAGSARVDEGSGLVTGAAGVAGPRKAVTALDGSRAGFSQWAASARAGVSWRFTEPRRTESGWVVDYELGASLGGGANATRSGNDVGGPALSGSLDGQVKRVSSGTVAFPDEARARAFYASPDPSLAMGPTADTAAALAMSPGSSARSEGSLALGASATGSAQALSLGVGAGAGTTSGVEVERLEGERVRVTVDASRAAWLDGSLGAGPVSLQGSARTVGMSSVAWQIDLSTPGGAAAYEALLTGAVPKLDVAGVQRDVSVKSSATSTGVGANVAGLSATVSTTATDTTRVDGQGRRTEQAVGTADVDARFGAASWFGWHPWKNDIGLSASTHSDKDGTELGNEVQGVATVSGGNAKANYETLGQAAGTATWAGHSGAGTPGTFKVTVDFGDDSLDDLVEILTDPGFSPAKHQVDPDVVELGDALEAAAGDREKQREAIQDYGDRGHTAIGALRRLLRDEQVFVELVGNTTWIGKAGWDEVEREMQKLALGGELHPEKVEKRAQELLATHEGRLYDLTDYGRYDDVPKDVRNEEILRTKSLLTRLEGLLPEAEADFVGPTIEGAVAGVREEMEKWYSRVRGRERKHGVGDTGGSTLRGDLGDTGWYGFWSGPERGAYDEAEALVLSGEEARREGNAAEASAKDFAARGHQERARARWETVRQRYERALADFRTAFRVYTDIEGRNGIDR